MPRYQHLSDAALTHGFDTAFSRVDLAAADLLEYIADFDERKLYVPAGYPSLLEYCVGKLKRTRDSVRRQIRDYRPLVKRRGLMAFHDCDPEGGAYPGVWTAVEGELLHGAADVVDHAGVLWVLRLRD